MIKTYCSHFFEDSPRSHGSSHRSSYESPQRNSRYESPSKKTPQFDSQKNISYNDHSRTKKVSNSDRRYKGSDSRYNNESNRYNSDRKESASRYKGYDEFGGKKGRREGDRDTGSSYLEPPHQSPPKQKLSFEAALGEDLNLQSEDSEPTHLSDWQPEDVTYQNLSSSKLLLLEIKK